MHVAICIVGFRNTPLVVQGLAALARSTYADFEVVVCENGGPEAGDALRAALPEYLQGGQRVECITAPGNLGYAGGVNVCMTARPDADAWWIVNPDAEPEPQALAEMVARLAQGDCDAVGGVLYHPEGTIQAYGGRWRSWLARAESIGHGTPLDAPIDQRAVERQLSYLLGACMLMGRRFVEQTGLMRHDYFLYAEEIEWCLRARARGMRLGMAPKALVRHGQGGTTGSADALEVRPRLPIYLDERNKLNVVRDTTPLRLPVAAVNALLLTFMRFGRRGAWRQWGYALAGWTAGLRGLRGSPTWLG